jgi:multimeric flavodoxin WrbA
MPPGLFNTRVKSPPGEVEGSVEESRPGMVAILGSPRRGGNSDTLAAEFLKGAASAGLAAKVIIPTDLALAPCDGKNRCFADGNCMIADGMDAIYDEVLAARRLVVATPVYFMGPPGSLKSFIDRFQAVWARSEILDTFDPASPDRRRDHKAFAIVTCGVKNDPGAYRPAVSIVKAFANVTGFDYAGELIATGLEHVDDASRRDDLLRQAFAAGLAFAEGA